MAEGKFRIDLEQVEAAAKMIQTMLDDLERPTAELKATVEQIKPTVYGTDRLAKSLTGSTGSVGGLAEHQTQVLEGIEKFLANSAQVAANLRLMVANYNTVDESNATSLRAIEGGDAPVAQAPPTTRDKPVTVVVAGETGGPVTAQSSFSSADAPTLDYNTWEDPEPPSHSGGGSGPKLA
ncbi:hypothetical protein [Kitasatospora camelliae]|uniref:Type VII secretion system (Wss) protein ESAT-6 n=1 Tax=Kitasatospora camelliae TaxID=3156397 RepID=A0AAU8JMN6_9ACTN